MSLTGNVEDAVLAEDGSVAECGEHRLVVVRDDRQLAPLHDVHLLAHVPLATHEVAGAEDRQFQLQHELNQQPGFTVLEDGDASQRVQMHPYGDLRFQFVR